MNTPLNEIHLSNPSYEEFEKIEGNLTAKLEREITSYLIFISERNSLLESITKEIDDLIKKADTSLKTSLYHLQSKIKDSIHQAELWGEYKLHFEKVHPAFFKKVTSHNEKLTQQDLKIAAYIKIGLSVKEMAQMKGVSPKSVEMAQYRLKKKLKLSPSENLGIFIRNI